DIWEPISHDNSVPHKGIHCEGRLRPYRDIWKLLKLIDGDIIYASKPLPTSFGIGLIAKYKMKKPLILDIDDWELGTAIDRTLKLPLLQKMRFLTSSTLRLYSNTSLWTKIICEKLVPLADEITTSNHFLHNKFGGTIIPHGRNTDDFDPIKYPKDKMRQAHQIDKDKQVVMFLGSIRAHKGIENIVKALLLNNNPNLIFILVGVDPKEKDPQRKKILEDAQAKLGKRFIPYSFQPYSSIPEFLAIADIIIIPQERSLATVGQTPAKVFDAMSMAKPIIATNVNDLPEILNNCGWIIEPQQPEILAQTIQFVLDNPKIAEQKRKRARQKCIKLYSWKIMGEKMAAIFSKYKQARV
ncbi:MAG: glycosyltransferase, partial [Candidatus Ranarchaeia archaeon]